MRRLVFLEYTIPTIWPMLLLGAILQFCIMSVPLGRQELPLGNPLIYRETKNPSFQIHFKHAKQQYVSAVTFSLNG